MTDSLKKIQIINTICTEHKLNNKPILQLEMLYKDYQKTSQLNVDDLRSALNQIVLVYASFRPKPEFKDSLTLYSYDSFHSSCMLMLNDLDKLLKDDIDNQDIISNINASYASKLKEAYDVKDMITKGIKVKQDFKFLFEIIIGQIYIVFSRLSYLRDVLNKKNIKY